MAVIAALLSLAALATADTPASKRGALSGTWQTADRDGTICVDAEADRLRVTFVPKRGDATVVVGRYRVVDRSEDARTIIAGWQIAESTTTKRPACKQASAATTDVAIGARLMPLLKVGADVNVGIELGCAVGRPALEIFFVMEGEYLALEATSGRCALEPEITKAKVDLRRYAELRRAVVTHLGHAHMTRGMNNETVEALERVVGKKDVPLLVAMLHDGDDVVRMTALEVLQKIAPDKVPATP